MNQTGLNIPRTSSRCSKRLRELLPQKRKDILKEPSREKRFVVFVHGHGGPSVACSRKGLALFCVVCSWRTAVPRDGLPSWWCFSIFLFRPPGTSSCPTHASIARITSWVSTAGLWLTKKVQTSLVEARPASHSLRSMAPSFTHLASKYRTLLCARYCFRHL